MTRFTSSAIPPLPPTLHDEIGCAHQRVLDLAARDRELHFTSDAAGRLVVELRTVGGEQLGRIPLAVALEIIHGDDLDEALKNVPGCDSPSAPPAAA